MPDGIKDEAKISEKPKDKPAPDGSEAFARQFANLPKDVFKALNKLQAPLSGKMLKEFGDATVEDKAKGKQAGDTGEGKDSKTNKPKDGTYPGLEKGTCVTYKDGFEQKMRFHTGYEATFERNNSKSPDEITAVEIKGADGVDGDQNVSKAGGIVIN